MNSPVLVIGFNRPHRLEAALDSVRNSEARAVFVAIDGPRGAADVQGVDECVEVARSIDWAPAQLRIRDRNLGCQRGVVDAVSWFFDTEESGIIVEDDSVPDPSFYPFCAELLDRYAGVPEVLAIAGESRVPTYLTPSQSSYRFSYMGPAGAWATWRDRWQSFTLRRLDRDPIRLFRSLGGSDHGAILLRAHWTALALANRTRAMDSWAYPFMLEGIASRRLTATPNVNLVDDRGVGDDARHMASADALAQPHGAIGFPLQHPATMAVDLAAEKWSNRHEVASGPVQLARSGARFLQRLAK